jgi:hypothetical protein
MNASSLFAFFHASPNPSQLIRRADASSDPSIGRTSLRLIASDRNPIRRRVETLRTVAYSGARKTLAAFVMLA